MSTGDIKDIFVILIFSVEQMLSLLFLVMMSSLLLLLLLSNGGCSVVVINIFVLFLFFVFSAVVVSNLVPVSLFFLSRGDVSADEKKKADPGTRLSVFSVSYENTRPGFW